jgi:hypothetical protein
VDADGVPVDASLKAERHEGERTSLSIDIGRNHVSHSWYIPVCFDKIKCLEPANNWQQGLLISPLIFIPSMLFKQFEYFSISYRTANFQ